jgi:glyoxalase family protein
MSVRGLHHITLVCSNAQRTVDFYTRVLGLRLIKKTVNFDDPGSYHLYFGDAVGTPGTAITFFEWANAPRGYPGIGGTQHVALQVADYAGVLKWKRRLTDLGVPVHVPVDQRFFNSIYFNDPDGVVIAIATVGPGWARDEHTQIADQAQLQGEMWDAAVQDVTPEMSLCRGMHHITAISSNLERTEAFYTGLLGMPRVKALSDLDDPRAGQWFWGVADGLPGTLVSYIQRDPRRVARARYGVGQTHHFALAVPDADEQLAWREKLVQAGQRVSPVMDRIYFKSIYTNDPDGHIVELATLGPGFSIDEETAHLGECLKLPPWLEKYRDEIEPTLAPIAAPVWTEAQTA